MKTRTSAILLIGLFVSAGCGTPRNGPLQPTRSTAASAPDGVANPGSGSTTVDWGCMRSGQMVGVPLGIPVRPACANQTGGAAIQSLRSAGGAATVPAPTNLSASVNGSTVTLSWSAPAGPVSSYIVEAGSFPLLTDLANFDTGSAATALVVLNVPARIYWVRVRAQSSAGVSDPSNEITVVVSGAGCTGELFPPFVWHASGAGSLVTLLWDPPQLGCPPTDYVIEAGSTPGATNLANFRTGTSEPRYDARGVAPGTYYVRLRSANELGVGIPGFEHALVVGTGCFYGLNPSTIFITKMASPGSLEVETSAACPWTMTADAEWLLTAIGTELPTSGQGPRRVRIVTGINIGPARMGNVLVRWPGGGVDIPVTQGGFM